MTHVLRRLPPLILAAALLLGGLAHFRHDLEHAACDPVGARDPHPCTACSVMHVGAPVADEIALAAPASEGFLPAVRHAPVGPVADHRAASIPRAPPIA